MMSIDAEEDISDSTGTKPTTATLLNASYTSTNIVDESVNSAIINVSNFPVSFISLTLTITIPLSKNRPPHQLLNLILLDLKSNAENYRHT